MNFILSLDIGGTHIAGAFIDKDKGKLVANSYFENKINTCSDKNFILEAWVKSIQPVFKEIDFDVLSGISISMPGPFDYKGGISLIKDLDKYDALYGVNIRKELKKRLGLPGKLPIYFENDATCFAIGEAWKGAAFSFKRVLGITLGTGLGAAFINNKEHISRGETVPEGGTLYQTPYEDGIAEDRFSARGLLRDYLLCKGEKLKSAKIM